MLIVTKIRVNPHERAYPPASSDIQSIESTYLVSRFTTPKNPGMDGECPDWVANAELACVGILRAKHSTKSAKL